jgi:hypothetical protein
MIGGVDPRLICRGALLAKTFSAGTQIDFSCSTNPRQSPAPWDPLPDLGGGAAQRAFIS